MLEGQTSRLRLRQRFHLRQRLRLRRSLRCRSSLHHVRRRPLRHLRPGARWSSTSSPSRAVTATSALAAVRLPISARLDPRYHPYRWKLTSEAFITFNTLNGQLISPFQDYSLLLTLPDLTSSRRLRLEHQAGIHRRAHPEVLWNRKRHSTPAARRADRRHGIPAASPDPLCRGPLPLLQTVLSPGGERLHAELAGGPATQPAGTGTVVTFARDSRDHRKLRPARGRAAGGGGSSTTPATTKR